MPDIATILDDLHDTFEPDEQGEDYALAWSDPQDTAAAAQYWADINEAREVEESVTYDGLLFAATLKAQAATDPNLKTDALLEVAATALAFADSVQRQTNAFTEADAAVKGKAKGGK